MGSLFQTAYPALAIVDLNYLPDEDDAEMREALDDYGVSYDQIILNNEYRFDSVKEVYATQHESTLGNLFSDSYKWAIEKATGEKVDASVQPLMSAAQLFFSGVEYSFNTNRMLFDKVDYAMLRCDNGLEKIEDDKMYSVVTGMYAGQMFGSVKVKSFGLLSITPKNEKGEAIPADELVNYVVRDENGNPVKEWYAITSYMQEMGGEMDEAYSKTDGRKIVYSSLKPVDLLKQANKFTYILLAVIVVLIAVVVLVVTLIVRKIKEREK